MVGALVLFGNTALSALSLFAPYPGLSPAPCVAGERGDKPSPRLSGTPLPSQGMGEGKGGEGILFSDYFINYSVFSGFFGAHEIISVSVLFHFGDCLSGMAGQKFV